MTDLTALIASIVKTYDGQGTACVQIDPSLDPTGLGDTKAYLMILRDPQSGPHSVAVGTGRSLERALESLAAIRGIYPEPEAIAENTCWACHGHGYIQTTCEVCNGAGTT